METLISKFPPEPSYHKIPHLPVVLCSKISVREAQGSGLRPRICTSCLLSLLRTKVNTNGASCCYFHFLSLLWRGSVTRTSECTIRTYTTSQTPCSAWGDLIPISKSNSELGRSPLLKIRGCQSAYNEKGTWGREVFALSVKCKQMSSFWRPPCLIQQGHMRNHGWKETWVSCFLRCLTTTAAVWI